jgi:asparagine synthase (glutamine-hydrolysing)
MMCGIVGYIGKNSKTKKNLIDKMLNSINHRGPDGSSVNIYNNCIIGFNRLSINDLSDTGMQPFEVNDKVVFANGEIYNHLDLKNKFHVSSKLIGDSDIEIIPHIYNELGFDFLNELNGGFAIAVYEKKSEKLYLIIDRFGKKPMYYYQVESGIFFSSELKAILLNFNLEIDKKAMNIGFFQGYFSYPLTPVKGVKKIRPGEVLTINPDLSLGTLSWYKMQPNYSVNELSIQELENSFCTLLDDAVDIRMTADVEAGLYLSGGLDSTAIAASCSKLGYNKIHTFSGTVRGKEYSTDNYNATRFASEYNFIHHVINIDTDTYRNNIVETCTAFDEINFETANINFIEIAREAKKYVTIMLDGCGGDEVFFGYSSQASINRLPKFARNIFPSISIINNYLAKNSPKLFSYYIALSDIERFMFLCRSFIPIDVAITFPYFDIDFIKSNLQEMASLLPNTFKSIKDQNYLSYLDIIGNNMLNYQQLDRCSMFHTIEPRSPLSDYRIWEAFLGVDEKLKFDGGTKGLMKRILRNRLPDYILSAEKDGFSNPFHVWFKEDKCLRDELLLIVEKRIELLCEILGDEYVTNIINKWKNIRNINWMDGVRLHQLVAFVIWYFIYFERKDLYKKPLTLEEFCLLI